MPGRRPASYHALLRSPAGSEGYFFSRRCYGNQERRQAMNLPPAHRPAPTDHDNPGSAGRKADPSAHYARSRSKINKGRIKVSTVLRSLVRPTSFDEASLSYQTCVTSSIRFEGVGKQAFICETIASLV